MFDIAIPALLQYFWFAVLYMLMCLLMDSFSQISVMLLDIRAHKMLFLLVIYKCPNIVCLRYVYRMCVILFYGQMEAEYHPINKMRDCFQKCVCV